MLCASVSRFIKLEVNIIKDDDTVIFVNGVKLTGYFEKKNSLPTGSDPGQ